MNKKLKILETKIQQFVIKKCKHISAKNLTVYLKVIFWIKNVSIFDRKKGNFWHNKFFFLWLKKVIYLVKKFYFWSKMVIVLVCYISVSYMLNIYKEYLLLFLKIKICIQSRHCYYMS